MKTIEKLYPESGVELKLFTAKHYDKIMNTMSLGLYRRFIRKAIADIQIKPADKILDLGCGTGRNDALMLIYLGENGRVIGLDLSPIMRKQFEHRFSGEKRVQFLQQRIDVPFDLNQKFDIVFISFVLHGFPHEVRNTIIENANKHLNNGGTFAILDFAEFDMEKMPTLHRKIFKTIECQYAFDFIKRDWRQILSQNGFNSFIEHFYFNSYVKLLKASKKNER